MTANNDFAIQSDDDLSNLPDPKGVGIEEEESDDSGEPQPLASQHQSIRSGSNNPAVTNSTDDENNSSNSFSFQNDDEDNLQQKQIPPKNRQNNESTENQVRNPEKDINLSFSVDESSESQSGDQKIDISIEAEVSTNKRPKKKQGKKKRNNQNIPNEITAPPKRRHQFDGSDIDVKREAKNQAPLNISIASQHTLSTLSESDSQNEPEINQTDRNIKKAKISHISSDLSGIGTSQLESTASTKSQTDRDLSQVPLQNYSQSEFKKRVRNAVSAIKSQPKPPKGKELISQSDAVEYSLADYSALTEEDVQLSNVPVNKAPNFKSNVKKAVVSIKSNKEVNPQEFDTTSQFNSSRSGRSDLANQGVHMDLSKQQRRSPKGHHKSQYNEEVYEEDEEDELSENTETSSEYLNGISEFEAVREVKYRIDNLVSPAMQPYLDKGLRVRPSENAKEGVVGKLELPTDNGEMVFDSEVSDLDVDFNTDKKKFQKPQIIGKSPTSKLPKLDGKSRSSRYTTPRTPYSETITELDSSEAPSFYSSESSELHEIANDLTEEIEQEDSFITNPMKFEIAEADSDDDRSMLEKFKKNADLRLSSSSESSTSSSEDEAQPIQTFTPVKEQPHKDDDDEEPQLREQEIQEFVVSPRSIQPNHKDRTVTKGKIQLYLLSSSSSDEQQVDDNDEEDTFVQTRDINHLSDSSNDEEERITKTPKKEIENDFDGNVKLKVTVVEARNLPESQTLALDPYCMISVKDKKKWQRTKTIRSTTKPIWDQQFTFTYNIYQPNTLTKRDVFLYIRLLSEDKFVGDRDLSSNQINLKDMKMSQFIDKWIRLHPSDSRKRGGEIHLTFLIEKNSTDVEVSPRRASLRDPEPNYYLMSPRAQTPNQQANPFDEDEGEPASPKGNTQKRKKVSQTPTETNSLRSWTTTSSDSKAHTSDKINGTCSLPKIQQFDEEEEEEEEEAFDPQHSNDSNINHELSESKDTPEEDFNAGLPNKNKNGSLSPISPPSENHENNHNSIDLEQLPQFDSSNEIEQHTPVSMDEISAMSQSADNDNEDDIQNSIGNSPPINSSDDDHASSSNAFYSEQEQDHESDSN